MLTPASRRLKQEDNIPPHCNSCGEVSEHLPHVHDRQTSLSSTDSARTVGRPTLVPGTYLQRMTSGEFTVSCKLLPSNEDESLATLATDTTGVANDGWQTITTTHKPLVTCHHSVCNSLSHSTRHKTAWHCRQQTNVVRRVYLSAFTCKRLICLRFDRGGRQPATAAEHGRDDRQWWGSYRQQGPFTLVSVLISQHPHTRPH